MKRDIDLLATKTYDLLIIGGGIYGAALAREAALSGLSVTLVDQGDFGAATSANSLKIIHGGLRYLQQLDLPRLRQSLRERRCLMRLGPHLVHPLPCALPTQGWALKSRAAMFCGLKLNNWLGWDRNRGLPPEKKNPPGRVGSRAEWLRIAPDLDDSRYTGVALWHDAYAYNTERLVLGFIQAAVEAGAQAANYVEVTGFQKRGRNVTGATAVDRLTGRSLAIPARLTVINTGPWTRQTLNLLGENVAGPKFRLALAMNLVLRRQLIPRYAVGLTTRSEGWKTSRLFFFVPWRERTMVGTYLRPHEGRAESLKVTEDDIRAFIASLNQAYPGANLQLADIAFVQAGLLPAKDEDVAPGAEPRLLNHFQIIDHARADGIGGLMTVLGVKYTTARDVAQRTMQRVAAKLGRAASQTPAERPPLPGGDFADLDQLIAEAAATGMPRERAKRLVYNYGAGYSAVLQLGGAEKSLLAPVSAKAEVIGAEIVHAVRHEMAVTLADVALRRTELGSAGAPDDLALRNTAALIAQELLWNEARAHKEIEEVKGLRYG
ncbi:MAG: glycerol-3-phosphate dehydrogenase/oxidase [Lentisphaerae bacterium]|nr:glycerol-3-phosphate dehydrogenase/oxidase [Lentisphaerota bacterium]